MVGEGCLAEVEQRSIDVLLHLVPLRDLQAFEQLGTTALDARLQLRAADVVQGVGDHLGVVQPPALLQRPMPPLQGGLQVLGDHVQVPEVPPRHGQLVRWAERLEHLDRCSRVLPGLRHATQEPGDAR